MENVFDPDNYPDTEPASVKHGDTWHWTRSDITSTYPTATYTLKYVFDPLEANGAQVEVTASKIIIADTHVVEVSSDKSKTFEPGKYRLSVVIVRDSDAIEKTIETGLIEILPSSGDVRSHNRKVLDAIRAVIAKTATKEQQSYNIAGRSLTRRTVTELREFEREYLRRVRAEEKAINRKLGKAKSNTVKLTMSGR